MHFDAYNKHSMRWIPKIASTMPPTTSTTKYHQPLQSHCVIRLSLLSVVALTVFLQISTSLRNVIVDDGSALSFQQPVVRTRAKETNANISRSMNQSRIQDSRPTSVRPQHYPLEMGILQLPLVTRALLSIQETVPVMSL